jgi:RHS repeat-associated protein
MNSDGALNALFKYELDPLGNRKIVSSYQPMNAIPSWPNTSYTYDKENRLLTAGSATFGYDANGNLTKKTSGSDITEYGWDRNNMLAGLVHGGDIYSYFYDGLRSRIARTENSVGKRYVFGLAETDASGNITAYYVYGLGLISKITPTNQSYFYHFDGIASTIGMTDSAGNVVNKYAYDAFGKVLNQVETVQNPFKYVGQFGVMDEGNGLLYMRSRYYDPELGRFISKDPIGFLGGDINFYAYVQSNPINAIDPLGLQWYKSRAVLLDIAALAIDLAIPLAPPLAPILYVAGATVSVSNTLFTLEDWRQGNAEWYDFAVSLATTIIGFIPHPAALYGSDIIILIYDIYRAETYTGQTKPCN